MIVLDGMWIIHCIIIDVSIVYTTPYLKRARCQILGIQMGCKRNMEAISFFFESFSKKRGVM